jgi:hypothetical protein
MSKEYPINYLKSLAIIITDDSLNKSFRDFYTKSKKDGYMNLDNCILLLDKLEKYIKENKAKFKKPDLTKLSETIIGIYKDTYQKGDLRGKQLTEFNYSINFILLTIGVMPIKENGSQMSIAEAKKFINEVYKKH